MDPFDAFHLGIDRVAAFCAEQMRARDAWQWFCFLLPFFILCELPLYVVPPLTLLVRRLLGRDRSERDAQTPPVSALVVGYNEADCLAQTLDSLLDIDYPRLEIVVVDDGSDDRMYQVAEPYARAGRIRLFRNGAASGRGGRSSGLNLALRMASADIVLIVDSDSSIDRDSLLHLVAPFRDPRVGAVAGNLKVHNRGRSLWTSLQACEYLVGIGLHRAWLDLFGMCVQISGAFGAFRRQALEQVGGFDPELAEDADISVKVRKSGWRVVFVPRAVCLTDAPVSLRALVRQRLRWDRGFVRTFLRKHGDVLRLRRRDRLLGLAVLKDSFFVVVSSYLLLLYLTVMACLSPALLGFTLLVLYPLYAAFGALGLAAAISLSERRRSEWALLLAAPLLPLYHAVLRVVRLYAHSMEFLRLRYEDPHLPASAWRTAPRW